uniref:Uncharacterized protein n=1 Tax=Anguilla anguilla TaxID=7936 RepID=A0A0E9VJN2_ANGAN
MLTTNVICYFTKYEARGVYPLFTLLMTVSIIPEWGNCAVADSRCRPLQYYSELLPAEVHR